MAGLQRSSETFRRSGSSGLVWDDKKSSGEIKPPGDGGALERSRSAGHAHGHAGYRAAGRVPRTKSGFSGIWRARFPTSPRTL